MMKKIEVQSVSTRSAFNQLAEEKNKLLSLETAIEAETSSLGELNEKINDFYLKANGTQGTVTYGYVVRLAVSYYNSEK